MVIFLSFRGCHSHSEGYLLNILDTYSWIYEMLFFEKLYWDLQIFLLWKLKDAWCFIWHLENLISLDTMNTNLSFIFWHVSATNGNDLFKYTHIYWFLSLHIKMHCLFGQCNCAKNSDEILLATTNIRNILILHLGAYLLFTYLLKLYFSRGYVIFWYRLLNIIE